MTLSRTIRHLPAIAATALLVTAVGLKTVHAAGTDTPTDDKKKDKKGSAIEQQDRQLAKADYDAFVRGYRAARDLILAGQYDKGIAAMHAATPTSPTTSATPTAAWATTSNRSSGTRRR